MDGEELKFFLGKRLQIVREQSGLSKNEVSRRIGTSQPAIRQFEHGDNWPNVATLYDMANVYGTSVDYLLGRTDNPHLPAKGGEEVEEDIEPRIKTLEDRMTVLQTTVDAFMTVMRSQLPITPAEWNRMMEQARRRPRD